MAYDYDILCIGLGPAGMAVSIMGSNMGLKVCAVEKHKIGGECMNVGCIPSKSLLRLAKNRHVSEKYDGTSLEKTIAPKVLNPFSRVRDYVTYINEKKTLGMFEKVDLVLGQGAATFVNKHTVEVGGRKISARRIFLGAGTRPMVPDIPGLKEFNPLTNETMFNLDKVPESLVVLGGGAIACEMAQAFSRLGSKVTMIIRGERLLRRVVSEAATDILEARFAEEGISILKETNVRQVDKIETGVRLHLDNGETLEAEHILAALGRRYDFSSLNLDKAGIEWSERTGIKVNNYLQTTAGSVYATGDCNGYALLSHAAMHQGMIALMNAMMPWPMKRNFKKFVVPWTVFTDPQISHVGMTVEELSELNIAFEEVTVKYEDYGAAIAEGVDEGFVTAYTNTTGKIYGVTIVGEGSGNMINEWGLAIQKGIRMHDIMLLQHSFPTMGFLSKRVSEQWMMGRMQSDFLKRITSTCFRLFSR